MSLCNTFRSFTILLLIELAVLESQVNAFTIQRIQGTNDSVPDLIESESALQLKSKNDLTPNDVKVIDIKNDGIQKIVPIETTAKTEDIKKNVGLRERSSTQSSTRIGSTEFEEIKDVSSETSTVLTTSVAAKSESTSEDITETSTKEQDIQQTTVLKPSNFTTKETENTSIGTTTKLPLPDEFSATTKSTEVTNVTERTTKQEAETKNISSYNSTPMSAAVNTSYSTRPVERKETVNITSPTSSTSKAADNIISQVVLTTTQITKRSAQSERSVTGNINTTTTGNYSSSVTPVTVSKKETNNSTEAITRDYNSATVLPYWKKYTMIERRRGNSTTEKNTSSSKEKEDELVLAGSAQSSVSLDKAFSITSDIPSLEKLKNELLYRTSKLPSTENPSEFETSSPISSTLETTLLSDSSAMSTKTNDRTNRIEVVSSKRAGFLDLSSRPTTEAETKSESVTATSIGILTTTTGALETTAYVPDKLGNTSTVQFGDKVDKKESGMASQSQLAEDAINEELMKEEMLKDNVENAKRYREERFDINSVNASTEAINPNASQFQPQEQISQEASSEDKLSVKPISTDKKSALYTVSPNYKPLKKIEVQPPKPFVRNPDDNSWRNESLSSLGIVFKAKNSSKPFTQVLKNKTEVEWNSLLEKYNKDDEPELRERLVKISEIRKKKKKVDKFGETVYADYEESTSSSESASVQNGNFPESVIVPIAKNISSTTITTNVVSDIVTKTTPMRVYMHTETKKLTTTKPKKQYNIESYDVEEEDADYVTLPNIDIKKYITTAKAMEKIILPPKKPILEYLPERKATVQYFPPRIPQKVQVNEYDDLQNKLNQYTIKPPPKKVIPIEYPTMPAVLNQKLDARRQKTMRPTEYAMTQKSLNLNENMYQTRPDEVEQRGYDGNFNRGSYVIKHLRDFLDEAAKDISENDDDRYPPRYMTESPLQGVTANDLIKKNKEKPPADYYDYEAQFRKDVLEKFVENFNQNSDRFKVDFPILYNTSVVHSNLAENGKVHASSSAFVKRLYDDKFKPIDYAPKTCDPNCEKNVELSPAYELHYYVPEEEEKQEVDPKSITLPYRYRFV